MNDVCTFAGAPGDGGSAGDGAGAATDCWAHWMDGSVAIDPSTVKEITELSTAGQDMGPWISKDGLRMYFSHYLTSQGQYDIYSASRSSATGTFVAATPATNLNTLGDEGRAWLTSDEQTLALATAQNIHMVTRVAGQPFGTPDSTHLTRVNAIGSMRFDPFLTDDLRRLYFSADTGPAGRWQLWIAARATANDDFGAPSLVPGVNDGTLNEFGPALYQNEQLLVFSPLPGNATADLYYAMRSSATGTFGMAAKIPTVNTGANEIEPVLSVDGCDLYFASDRDPGGSFHLFHAAIVR